MKREVRWKRKKALDSRLYNLYCPSVIDKVIKSRWVKWTRKVARIAETPKCIQSTVRRRFWDKLIASRSCSWEQDIDVLTPWAYPVYSCELQGRKCSVGKLQWTVQRVWWRRSFQWTATYASYFTVDVSWTMALYEYVMTFVFIVCQVYCVL